MLNIVGKAWKEHGITQDQVLNKNKQIADGSKELWEFARSIISKAVEKGYLSKWKNYLTIGLFSEVRRIKRAPDVYAHTLVQALYEEQNLGCAKRSKM